MTTQTDVNEVIWNLELLVDDRGEAGVDDLLDGVDRIAGELETRRGQVAEFDSERLIAFMHRLGELRDMAGRASSYAGLLFTADTTDPKRGALMQRVEERLTRATTRLTFFEIEWAAVDEERVEELLADDGLDFCRHFLRSVRRYRPHLLTEPEEMIMTEKNVTGASAWQRLFDELTSALEIDLDGQKVGLEAALSRLVSPDREVRKGAAEAVTRGLQGGIRTRAYIFNTLLSDKATNDRLRSYESWIQSMNLANEASDESVEALIKAVRSRYDISQRWYSLKARILGIERLADYDRMASLATDEVSVEWRDARHIVLESYASFSGELSNLAGEFFDKRWIDAPPTPGKRPGAFCAYTVPSRNPYVLLNYTARRRDVLTLAHELGHGVHGSLSRRQGIFHQTMPLTVAETASVFGETIVFNRLLEMAGDPESRLALLAENIEGSLATVFRQIAMNRFEDLAHAERRNEGELTVERFGELWAQSQSELFGDSMEVTSDYHSWWSYIPHFIHTPGYVYAYAYGQLLALSVYKRFEEQGSDFVPRYLEMLGAGGSMSPEDLARIVDCDLSDPGFWDGGLSIIDSQLEAAETAARDAGRL